MAAVKLIGMDESPFVRRVDIALKLKGVEYEYIKEDLWNKSPLLLKYNPVYKKVPVLVHNDKPICESLVIVEYIDEIWKGNPILPEDPYERAKARFWAKFIDDKSVIWKSFFLKGEEQEKAIKEAKEALKILNDELKDKKFFGGDKIGLPDIAANVIALWPGVLQEFTGFKLMSEEEYPRLFEWSEEFLNCNVIKENMPGRERLLAYFHERFPTFGAPK